MQPVTTNFFKLFCVTPLPLLEVCSGFGPLTLHQPSELEGGVFYVLPILHYLYVCYSLHINIFQNM